MMMKIDCLNEVSTLIDAVGEYQEQDAD